MYSVTNGGYNAHLMKIGLNAHLLSARAGFRTAGVHGYIYNLLRCLPAAAPDDWTFTAMVGGANQTTFDGITMRRAGWDTESPIRRILWEQFAQPSQLREFDLYHALAFVSPFINSTPSVVTVYDLSFIHYPGVHSAARRLYLRLFTALSCQRARRVIGISQSTARDVHQSLGIPMSKIDIATGAYDADAFKPLPAHEVEAFKWQNSLPDRFWLFVGTLEPRKNLPTLLRAYAALPPAERLPLILAGGKGWQYEEIFSTVEQHGLTDAVRFPGFISPETLALWYNSAEVFIYPSVFEGFGLPVLEALACGLPALVSDASSLPEAAGDAGKLVPPHDVEAWTNALRSAYHDADWRAEARERGLRYAGHFSWSKTAGQTVASYKKALAFAVTS